MEMNLYPKCPSTVFSTIFLNSDSYFNVYFWKLKVTLVRNFMSPFPVFPESEMLPQGLGSNWLHYQICPNAHKGTSTQKDC